MLGPTSLHVLLATAVPTLALAQSPISPPPRATTEANSSSAIPFSSAAPRRYQELHSNLPQAATAIRGLSWRQNGGTGTFTGTRSLDLQVSLGRSIRSDTIGFVFAANFIGAPTVVMARRRVDFGPQGQASSPGPSAFHGMSITFDAPFVWNGAGSLAWEATIFAGSASGLFADADAEDAPRNHADDVAAGTGCTASNNNDPMRLDVSSFALGLGTYYAPFVRAASPDSPLFLMLGVRDPDVALPGLCHNLRTDLVLTVPLGATDSVGNFQPVGSQVIFVQRDLGGVTLHAQAMALDARSTFAIPLVLSNGVATTFRSPGATFPDASRIYTDGEAVGSPLAPFRSDAVGFSLVTRFDT